MVALPVSASAPAKAIFFGEHAVNRAQSAIAVAVGLRVTCTLEASMGGAYRFATGSQLQTAIRSEILELGAQVDVWRAARRYASLRELVGRDYFAPAKYVLAGLGDVLPDGLKITWTGEIPPSGGLGSGGAAFAALAVGIRQSLALESDRAAIAKLAWRGDVVAHGGIASGLDTATSVYGGAIRYSLNEGAVAIPSAPGLTLVIGDSGKPGATALANAGVSAWLEQRPHRQHHFIEIGLLARLAEPALEAGDWARVGNLMNLNQLILEQIGVSTPDLRRLIEASLEAGALGAKLSGSGGGGIMLALVTPDRLEAVGAAIRGAGGAAIHAPVGVAGVQLEPSTVEQLVNAV